MLWLGFFLASELLGISSLGRSALSLSCKVSPGNATTPVSTVVFGFGTNSWTCDDRKFK
jgi:hypothetical protein